LILSILHNYAESIQHTMLDLRHHTWLLNPVYKNVY